MCHRKFWFGITLYCYRYLSDIQELDNPVPVGNALLSITVHGFTGYPTTKIRFYWVKAGLVVYRYTGYPTTEYYGLGR